MERMPHTGWHSVILCSCVVLLVLGVGPARGGVGDTPRRGGTLRVVSVEPASATLDPHETPSRLTFSIAMHYLEGLYAWGQDGSPIPMLAEGHTVSADGLVYTFKLRRGVPFHNGKELTAADVVPSLRRWGRKDTDGKRLFTHVASVQALDPYSVQIRLTEPTALVLPLLVGAICPKEVVDEAGDGLIKTFIGTGPFTLADYQPHRSLTLVRFAQYRARPEPPNGLGGGKTAWLDTVRFLFIPDPAARAAALESGEADFLYASSAAAERDLLQAHPDIKILRRPDPWIVFNVLNTQHGVFANVRLRQAALAALDLEATLRAVIGSPEYYRHDASLAPKDSPWWTDVGQERYNQQDKVRARRLLQEAGYQGEPIRYMIPDPPGGPTYRFALVTKQQLEEVGFTVDFQVVEWPTLRQRLPNPALWDAYPLFWLWRQDPTLLGVLFCDARWGWTCDPDVATLFHALETELQYEKRYRLWQAMQQLFWERVPAIHYGHTYGVDIMRKHVHGPFDMPALYFWNVWVER